ncbi:TPA: type IV conjugative transfer system protein TraE [Neisseria meningitidis]|nr:type IV conjugative transfer system protein TraE [Neisseria meningitidis]
MKTENMLSELAIRTGIKVFFWILLGMSIAVNLFLSATLLFKGTIVQTTLTPPEIRRSMTVSNIAFSKEYLEEMAPYTAYLLLNVTPKTVDYQNSQLLKIVSPDYKDALERELSLNALWVKKNNVSTTFSATEATADISDNTVSIRGIFEVKRNNTLVEQKDRELLISFKNNYGTLQLLSIKEVQKRVTKAEPAGQEKSEVETEDVEISKTATEFKGGN